MKRILSKAGFVLLVALMQLLSLPFTATADQPIFFETFDNWRNPFVAEGWATHSVGGRGRGYNQVYEAAQEMTTGPGDVNYYRSIYKDFEVEPGKEYSVSYDYRGFGLRAWIQIYDGQNQLSTSAKGLTQSFPSIFTTQHVPNYLTRFGHVDTLIQTAIAAPAGARRMRLVFQAEPNSVVHLRNVILQLAENPTFDQWGNKFYTYRTLAGPFINRNTEFSGGVNTQFGVFMFGNLPGEYAIKPTGGSSQGISAGGTFADFRSIYKDLKVTPGQKYKLSVDVISNSTNESGTRVPSPVRIWVQYDDKDGRVLSTHGIDGMQAGIKGDTWTTATVPGPAGESYTIAPSGANHARIILQVMGGTGGGTVFDSLSLTQVD